MDRLQSLVMTTLAVCALVAVQVDSQRGRDGIQRTWPVNEFPDPHSHNLDQQRRCGRNNMSSVCDPNRIISATAADAIDDVIDSVYRETTSQCANNPLSGRGYIIRVALMPYMERVYPDSGNSTMQKLRDAQMYSYMLTLRWQMDGQCGDTLLILYAKHQNILYTLTRPHTRRRLSNDDVIRVTLIVRPYFDQDNTIADGIIEMIKRYKLILSGRRNEAFSPAAVNRGG